MKNAFKVLGSLACFGVAAFGSVQANAACTAYTNHAIFVFDQSNSMNLNGSKTVNGVVMTAPKTEIALALAKSKFATLAAGTEVAVVGFGNTTIGGDDYYHNVISFDAGLVKGINDTAITAAFTNATTIGTSYWTPFAGGACDALYNVWEQGMFDECDTRQIFLMTDGMENSTPTSHSCYSATSSSTAFNADLAGSGFGLTAGSWERKVASLAYAADPEADQLDSSLYAETDRPVFNVAAIFDYIEGTSTAVANTTGADVRPTAGYTLLSDFGTYGLQLLQGLATATRGSYFAATTVNGVTTKIPVPGDTDPSATRSCVEKADLTRIKEALGHVVATGDVTFSVQDLAMRDVNDDGIVNAKDYTLAVKYLNTCAQ